jgi:hypothetical protein
MNSPSNTIGPAFCAACSGVAGTMTSMSRQSKS